jgi:[ribosomal protein S18]-alanine N-acetyltransferase
MIDLLNDTAQRMNDERGRILVVDMCNADVPDVMSLEKRCYSLPWSSNAYITEIGNPNAHYLVAKLGNGLLIGYGGVWVVMDEMHITTLAVEPVMRGRRIGERMLIRLLQEGMKRGAVRATLEVRQRNEVAHNLYLKYGFKDVAIRRAYYSDNGENAVIMWAEDVVAPTNTTMLRRNLRQLELLHGEPDDQ